MTIVLRIVLVPVHVASRLCRCQGFSALTSVETVVNLFARSYCMEIDCRDHKYVELGIGKTLPEKAELT
jgi:hypothetical protein